MNDMDRDIESIARAIHAAWGKHAVLDDLSQSMKWRYRKVALALVTELAKAGFSICKVSGDPSVMSDHSGGDPDICGHRMPDSSGGEL